MQEEVGSSRVSSGTVSQRESMLGLSGRRTSLLSAVVGTQSVLGKRLPRPLSTVCPSSLSLALPQDPSLASLPSFKSHKIRGLAVGSQGGPQVFSMCSHVGWCDLVLQWCERKKAKGSPLHCSNEQATFSHFPFSENT